MLELWITKGLTIVRLLNLKGNISNMNFKMEEAADSGTHRQIKTGYEKLSKRNSRSLGNLKRASDEQSNVSLNYGITTKV